MQVQLLLLPDSRRQSEELALSKSRRLGANDCLDLRTLPHQVLFRGGRQFFQSARDRRGVADGDGPFDGGRSRLFANESALLPKPRSLTPTETATCCPLARDAGVHALWFGIEDLTATLINKGQKPTQTIELFRLLGEHKISPMAMMMFHEGQPYHTPGALYGLYNQIKFLHEAGAVSVQCTVHSPAVGTREQEATYAKGGVLRSIGGYTIPEFKYDGNHVVIVAGEAPWKRQVKLIGGYAAFYNPANFVRALKRDGSPLRRRRIRYQLAGMAAMIWTAAKMTPYILRLMTGKPSYRRDTGATTIEIRHPDQAFPRWPTTVKQKDRLTA